MTNRTRVYRFPSYPSREFRPEWVAIFDRPEWMTQEEYDRAGSLMTTLGYTLVAHQNGIKLLRIAPVGESVSPGG